MIEKAASEFLTYIKICAPPEYHHDAAPLGAFATGKTEVITGRTGLNCRDVNASLKP